MVSRMAKPEEVLVVENDQGEVVREFMKDTDAINLYKNMRETLGKLKHACGDKCMVLFQVHQLKSVSTRIKNYNFFLMWSIHFLVFLDRYQTTK